jgi:hypothetical protein
MIILILGWISTILVLIGFFLNAKQQLLWALIIWIIGDVLWVVYDIAIDNYSHCTLSTIVIVINVYGIFRAKKLTNS